MNNAKVMEVNMSSASAYSGDANGWIKERALRQRRYIPQLVAAAEASEKIAVTITMTCVKRYDGHVIRVGL